ncbi:MAG: hypothetical protein LBQ66_16370 [Planctomycetaceae bacterium]|nr:hypothetical protein [Planctomycetaceae bacterium]
MFKIKKEMRFDMKKFERRVFIILAVQALWLFTIHGGVLYSSDGLEHLPVLKEITRTVGDIKKTDERNEYMFAPVSSVRFSKKDGVPFRWNLIKRMRRSDSQETWQAIRINMKTFESKAYDLPEFDVSEGLRISTRLMNNRPQQADITVSPDSKYFIVKIYYGKSHLFDAESGLEIDFVKDKIKPTNKLASDVTLLGFNAHGNVYCGTQTISALLTLHDIQSGKRLKAYDFLAMNLPNDAQPIYEHWIGKAEYPNTVGIIYNILHEPMESPDGKWTVIPATVFQLRNLMAFVLICDNEKEEVAAQTLVDTTFWQDQNTVFAFSHDSRYLSIQDGRIKIQIYDTEKNIFSICNTIGIPVPGGTLSVGSCSFMNDNSIAFVKTPFSSGETKHQIHVWNIRDQKFSRPFWDILDHHTRNISVSPDGNFILTSHYTNPPEDKYFKKVDGYIACWDLVTKQRLFTLQQKGSFKVYIPPCWSVLEVHCSEPNSATSTRIYDLAHFHKHALENRNKIIAAQANTNEIDTPNKTKNNESIENNPTTDTKPAATNPQSNSFYDYRQWVTINGKRRVRARVISVDIDKDNKKIISLEDEQTKGKIQTFFDQLHDIDQKYMHEIDKKIKAEKSKEK